MKKINVHPDLLNVLTSIVAGNEEARTRVARTLVEAAQDGLDEGIFREDFCDYFSFAEDNKKAISYVKKDKLIQKLQKLHEVDEVSDELLNEYNEEFYTKMIARTRCKASKFLSRIFTQRHIENTFSNRDVEWFANQYTAIVGNEIDMKVVKGEDIRKYYHADKYNRNAPQGTLIGSCMAADRKQKFLDIYVENENISMLVAIDADGLVLGRALIWDNVSFKERDSAIEVHTGQFMDRVYHTHDWITDKFVNWAKEKGIWTKYQQGHADQFQVVNPENNEVENFYMDVEVKLNFKYLPYLDTFTFPNYKRGFITNKQDGYEPHTQMRQHDTGIPRMVWDSIEAKPVVSSDCKWGEFSKSWIHRDDNIRVAGDNFHKKLCVEDRLKGFITPKDTEVNCVITGDAFAERNMVESEHHSGMIHKKEAVETIDAGVVHKQEAVESKYLGSRLSKDGSIHLEKLDDYLPKTVLENGLTVDEFEKVLETLGKLKGETKTNFSESSTFVFEF